ncbi:MAG: DUF1993 family protein [Nevskia sp.]
MTISMYQASVPSFIRALGNLSGVLEKGAAYAETRKVEPSVLLNSRLYPDMFALVRQVQIATDMVKGGAARLAGVEPPPYADTEISFAELQARIARTIDYLKSFQPEQIDGSEARAIALVNRFGTLNFTGIDYLHGFVLPNLYFHSATAYNILRHCGVELGKQDFLGRR